MNRAWNEAMALLSANRQVVSIVAGVFFFLPYVVFMLAMPDTGSAIGDPETMEAAYAQMGDFYASYWWLLIILFFVQGTGMLGMLALLTDFRRPTVGEALAIGARKVLPYLGACLLAGFAIALIFTIVATISALAIAELAFVAILLLIPAMAYAMVKFSLVAPVLVKEETNNPIVAMRRSWRITKGNSFRVFGFYFLLMVVLLVVTMVISMLVAVLMAALGPEAGHFVNAIISSLINALWVTGFLAVLSAVHDQLSGTSAGEIAETFE